MNLSIATKPAPIAGNPINVAAAPRETNTLRDRMFDLALDLTQHDGQLEQFERQGNTYPGRSWSDWYSNASRRLSDATTLFAEQRPTGTSMVDALNGSVRELAFSAGQTRVMGDHGIVFGYGWGRDLDGPIQDIRDALSYLDRA